MTPESLISLLTVMFIVAASAERLIEVFKPLFERIKNGTLRPSVKLLSAIVIGMLVSALFRYDLFVWLGVAGVNEWVGYLASGLLSSTGSTTINRVLDWLKTLRSE